MTITVEILVALTVALTLACAFSLLLMRNAYELLQYSVPVVSVGMLLITVAVWLSDRDWQARIKVSLIGVLLFVMNSVLTHATARAVRIRHFGRGEAAPVQTIPSFESKEKTQKEEQ